MTKKKESISQKGLWIPREILKRKEIAGNDKMILAVIWYLVEKGRFTYAWPTNQSLSACTGLDKIDVRLGLDTLRDCGYISIKADENSDKRIIQIIDERIWTR